MPVNHVSVSGYAVNQSHGTAAELYTIQWLQLDQAKALTTAITGESTPVVAMQIGAYIVTLIKERCVTHNGLSNVMANPPQGLFFTPARLATPSE